MPEHSAVHDDAAAIGTESAASRPLLTAQIRRKMRKLLRDVFGFTDLREGQAEVIERTIAGSNVFAAMPTGAGKSLCYQIPALMEPRGITVVVSPLISLMKDQSEKLRSLGIVAVTLNSAINASGEQEAIQAVQSGSARLLFTTPERLNTDSDLTSALRQQGVGLFVIDEAHCISQWGHDFRPAYLELNTVRKALGGPRVLALSATASPQIIEDAAHQLGISEFEVVSTSVYRANLHYRVETFEQEEERLDALCTMVGEASGSGIIYAATVKGAERVYELLKQQGESVGLYHAKLAARVRNEVQEQFMAGELRIVVATNAFGLGIDKPDTRFVIHCQMPATLDSYYQESGRAGRDGDPAACTLLYLSRDRSVQSFFMAGRYPEPADLRGLYRMLGETPPNREDEGTSTTWTAEALEEALDMPKSRVRVLLSLLKERRIVSKNKRGALRLIKPDLKASYLESLLEVYRERAQRDHEMLERMIYYARSGRCRWRVLLEHFEEEATFEFCGTCDTCLTRQRVAQSQSDSVADSPSRATPLAPIDARNEPPSVHAAPSAEDKGFTPVDVDKPPMPGTAKTARARNKRKPVPPGPKVFQPGQAVRVPRYGDGEVAGMEPASDIVDIVFPDGARRSFMAAYVEPILVDAAFPVP